MRFCVSLLGFIFSCQRLFQSNLVRQGLDPYLQLLRQSKKGILLLFLSFPGALSPSLMLPHFLILFFFLPSSQHRLSSSSSSHGLFMRSLKEETLPLLPIFETEELLKILEFTSCEKRGGGGEGSGYCSCSSPPATFAIGKIIFRET